MADFLVIFVIVVDSLTLLMTLCLEDEGKGIRDKLKGINL